MRKFKVVREFHFAKNFLVYKITMNENDLHIDQNTHKRVPTTLERLWNAFFSIFWGFLLVNIIAFWMFPGPGIFGIHLFSNAHAAVAFIGDLTNVIVIAFLAICGVMGWFKGNYFTDRMKTYISYWKFW